MRIVSYLALVIIIVFGVTFAALNSEAVNINYYLGQNTLPLSLILVIAFTIGVLIGVIFGFYVLIKNKLVIYRLRQRLQLAEKEIENLRAIPLQDKV